MKIMIISSAIIQNSNALSIMYYIILLRLA